MNSHTVKTTALAALFAVTVAAHGGGAIAAGAHGAGKGHGHGMAIGEPGDAAKVDRTITITMKDNFFEPETIEIKEGETIRFVVANKGAFLHEFNLGTAAMHAAHQKEMAEMMEHGMITATGIDHKMMKMDHGGGKMMMEHNDPNSVLLEPGKQAEVIWHFTKKVDLEFACNVPGHYESGMMGPIQFKHGQ
ncbi:MAG: cupredoxin domain-containing protein [Proteobacteria bacterium]|nr:cupredoxin domain-containing protein [Pseudomonadota bacterium]